MELGLNCLRISARAGLPYSRNQLDGGLIARVGILLVYQHKNLHHLLALLSARLLIYSITASYSLGGRGEKKDIVHGIVPVGSYLVRGETFSIKKLHILARLHT